MKVVGRFVWSVALMALAYPMVRRLLERCGLIETIAEEWFRRVWRERDANAIDELLTEDGVAYGIFGEEIRGRAAFREFHLLFCKLFPETDIRVVDEISEGSRRAVRCLGKLKMPGHDETIELAGMGFVEIRGGQIRSAYNYWNFLGLLEEMSLMPKGSFEAAMSGELAPHPAAK